jgi:hypothetical protein
MSEKTFNTSASNGALIGSLAGLFLYSAKLLLRSAEAFIRLA